MCVLVRWIVCLCNFFLFVCLLLCLFSGLFVCLFLLFSRMRSVGFSFHLGGLEVKPCSPDVAQPSATVRMIALWLSQWGSAERVSFDDLCCAVFVRPVRES